MQISHRNFINPPQDLPSDDPLGIETWAASNGLPPHAGVALVASVLSGVAGNLQSFPLPSAQPDGGGVNLAGVEGDGCLAAAIGQLASTLKHAQEALVAKSKQFTAAELDDAMFVPGIRSRNADYLAKLGNPDMRDSDIHDINAETRLAKDMESSQQVVAYENLVRPRFLLPGSLPPNIAKVLSDYHSGLGLAAGSVVALPASTSNRNGRISEILAAVSGLSVGRSPGGNRTKITHEFVRLVGLLRFSQADYDWIIAHRRDFLTCVMPIVSVVRADDDASVDDLKVIEFLNLFYRVATNVLAARRTGSVLSRCFRTEVACGEFMRQQRAHVRELQEVPDDCRVHGAAGFPAAIAWALLLLAGKNKLDDYILHTAFSAARSLHADAARLFREHDQAALAEHRLGVARKLVTRFASIGPCKRRGLVRGLDQQALHLHEPVIQALIGIGIVTEDPNRVLRLGRVPIHQLTAKSLIHDTQP